MSASWNKVTIRPPCLPPELWYEILRVATAVPGVLEPEIYDPSDRPIEVCVAKQQKLLRQSLVTKRYVVRVCKQWHELATPLLYEALTVGLSRAMSSLCATLMDSNRRGDHTSNDYRPLGWHTKRLDIAIRDSRLQSHYASMLFDHITNVIGCLPRLSIAIFYIAHDQGDSTSSPAAMTEALANTCGPSLRCLYFFGKMRPSGIHLYKVLQAAPRLRVLHGVDNPSELSNPLELPNLNMPELTSLTIPRFDGLMRNNLPNIREIRFRIVMVPASTSLRDACIELYGHGLTIVHLEKVYDIVLLRRALNMLIRHCPNLMRLVLVLDSWACLHTDPNEELLLPPTPYLVLRCYRRAQGFAVEYRILFDTLSRMKGPNLKVVCFSDPSTVKDLVFRHARVLAEGLKAIRHCTFILVDDKGNPFSQVSALH